MVTPTLALGWSMKQINEWREAVKNFKIPSHNKTSSGGIDRANKWQCPEEGVLKLTWMHQCFQV